MNDLKINHSDGAHGTTDGVENMKYHSLHAHLVDISWFLALNRGLLKS